MGNRFIGWLTTFLYFSLVIIVVILGIFGLGLFGMPVTLLLMTLIYFSPSYRAWFYRQPGYRHRLAKLPFLGHPNPEITTTGMMVSFMPLSLFCLFLIFGFLIISPLTFLISVGLAVVGLLLLYGWAIKEWQLPFSATSKAAASRRQEQYFQRIRRLDQIKSLDPIAFENFVGSLFKQMGYQVQTTAVSGDEGIDLRLYRQGHLSLVQCKRYEGTVGQPTIRDLYGAMVHSQAHEAYLVTTGTLSLPARQWAANKPIHLIDGNGLIEWIETLKRDSLLAVPSGPPPWPQVFREISETALAPGLITFALAFLLLCWTSLFSIILFKQPLRQAGLLPSLSVSFPRPTPGGVTTPVEGDSAAAPAVIAGNQIINLRQGPGIEYEIIGTLLPGEQLEIVGRNLDTSWWQVAIPTGRAWVSGDVVEAINADPNLIPVRNVSPLAPALPTETPTPLPTRPGLIATATPGAPYSNPTGADCICSFDVYNCLDARAQICFEYCRAVGAGDVHRLDLDGNDMACDP